MCGIDYDDRLILDFKNIDGVAEASIPGNFTRTNNQSVSLWKNQPGYGPVLRDEDGMFEWIITLHCHQMFMFLGCFLLNIPGGKKKDF